MRSSLHNPKTLPRQPDGPANGIRRPLLREEGFVLVGSLLILLLLVLIGISATTSTSLELQIAAAERIRRETFYAADAGVDLGTQVLEENLSCPTGFTSGTLNGLVTVNTLDLWRNLRGGEGALESYTANDDDALFLTALRDGTLDPDIQYNPGGGQQQMNIAVIGGATEFTEGGALQIAAGYLGKGKGAASGGGKIVYDLYSLAQGPANSESLLQMRWRHIIGQEGVCNY